MKMENKNNKINNLVQKLDMSGILSTQDWRECFGIAKTVDDIVKTKNNNKLNNKILKQIDEIYDEMTIVIDELKNKKGNTIQIQKLEMIQDRIYNIGL